MTAIMGTGRGKALILAVCLVLLAGAAAQFWPRPVEGYGNYIPMDSNDGEHEASLRLLLSDESAGAEVRYQALFQYFLHGFAAFATPDCARVQFPGLASVKGYRMNGLEGFARTAPLLAAWIHSGRGSVVLDRYAGSSIDLVGCLKKGILAGTDSASPSYWGRMTDRDQRIVEAADIARVLWLTRDHLWSGLNGAERKQVADWLLQVNAVAVWPNNWLLFPVVVNRALDALGYEAARDDPRYAAFKAQYLGQGWYFDRPYGVDYYNAWGITYDLIWIHLLQPDFDRDFIRDALAQSAWLTAHLIGPQGIPILGRSICYRTAIPVPVIAGALVDGSAASHGRGRRALDVVWRYFVAHRSLRNFALTQGYFDTDPRFVDPYTGTGSCHWGLRSLVLALMQPRDAAFWTAPEIPLPVETEDYRLDLPALGWIVEGWRHTGEIRITVTRNTRTAIAPDSYSTLRRLAEWVTHRPMRPRNLAAKYDASVYSSLRPFPVTAAP